MASMTDICPHAEYCGGCSYQGVPYEEQLKNKCGEAKGYFEAAGVHPAVFDDIEGCPEDFRYAYRNKMEYSFGDLVKDGPLTLGMHKRGHYLSVVTVDGCRLVHEDFNKILRYTLDFCTGRGYIKYNKKKHTGLLRNLVVRRGVRTGELLINMVTSSDGTFDAKAWCEGILEMQRSGELENRVVGILQTINDALADAVYCDELRVIYGQDFYMEKILGLDFKVHEFAFFQTNVEAVERLYSEAIALIDDFSGKRVFDLYCGTGTISQVMAKSAGSVLGVELNPDSVEAAKANAELNGLSNCEFVCGDVFKVLEEREDRPDVIVVDPPRMGMSREAAVKIASYGVDQIVYVSCNPKTLARDLAIFETYGYEVKYAKPFDNFPMTKHIETVVLLCRNAEQAG